MEVETDLYDAGTLTAAIQRALVEKKGLICFISGRDEETFRWNESLLDQHLRERLMQDVVVLKLSEGSEQAGYLNAFCPVTSVPAVILVEDGQVTAHLQSPEISCELLQEWLASRYGNQESAVSGSELQTRAKNYIDLPTAPAGVMRLPNNAYDAFRKYTAELVSHQTDSRNVLSLQLQCLTNLHDEQIRSEIDTLKASSGNGQQPQVSDQVIRRLLNTPASAIAASQQHAPSQPIHNQSTDPMSTGALSADILSAIPQRSPPSPVPIVTASQPRAQSGSSARASASQQASSYRAEQKRLEEQRQVERQRIKDQIAADRAIKREAEAQRQAEAAVLEQDRRRQELIKLRKKNSTTANPSASDIRIQVRMFDGGTIRTSFPHDATINSDVRTWIKSAGNVNTPYNLKLVLTPLPNRNIEPGEENLALSDVEDIQSSATIVMVPVQGAVDSYTSTAASAATAIPRTILGGGYNLASGAATLLMGGVTRLFGGVESQQTNTVSEERMQQSSTSSNVRVRTLADQRADDEQKKRKDQQFYAGNGINIEPRKDDK